MNFGAGVTISTFSVNSPAQIAATIAIAGDAVLGTRDVSVTNPSGTGTKTGGLAIVSQTPSAPTIASVSPSEGIQGHTLTVVISGSNFTVDTAVSFGSGITTNSLAVDNSNTITVSVSIAGDATLGAREVSVTTPNGTATKAESFIVTEEGEASAGGYPFWIWIIVGVAAVLTVGVVAYLLGRRRGVEKPTPQTATGASRVEQAQKQTTSVADGANTQSKSLPPKGAQWKRMVGWVLFAWGLLGLLANIAFILVWSVAPLSVVVNSAVCILLIWGGWRLSHPSSP